MTRSNIDYKEIYANTYSYLTALSNINYTKSNIILSIIALVIAVISLILSA